VRRARYFDIDLIADSSSAMAHAMPSQEVFAEHLVRLGIEESDLIVLYDAKGIFRLVHGDLEH
jgi:thiosulfate/3-mercaptopyruvate sulfurtransferase